MSDRLAAVNAAQDADEARLRRIEDRSIDSCQPGVVDYCVAMLEELRVIREAGLHSKRLDLAGVEAALDCMWTAYQRADSAVTRAATIEQQQLPRL